MPCDNEGKGKQIAKQDVKRRMIFLPHEDRERGEMLSIA